MRTLRLAVASVAGIALLAVVGPAAAGQPDEVVVTGPQVASVFHRDTQCIDHDQLDVSGFEDGWNWFRGWTSTCQESLSDPRVSGLKTTVYNDDCFGDWADPCVAWGTEEIVGPEGTWVGSFRGTLVGDQLTSQKILHGTGAYEGLIFLWHGTGPMNDPTGSGLIYEGEPAPMPALAEIDVPALTSATPPTEPMLDPSQLPTVAASTTPPAGIGAVFMQPNGTFTPTHYILSSDGMAYSLNPFWGHGLGLWEPAADGTLSMSLVHPDADPSAVSEVPGWTIIDADGAYDPETDSLVLDWRATGEGAEDGQTYETAGRSVALRRHLLQMPAVAEVETPPDEGWAPVLAPGVYGMDFGGVAFANDGEEQMLQRDDGTSIGLNPWIGDWLAQAATVDGYFIASSWWGPTGSAEPGLVAQSKMVEDATQEISQYGTTEDGWWGSNVVTFMEITPFDEAAGLPPKAGSDDWPERSSLWIEQPEEGLGAFLQLNADGTAVRIDLDEQRAPSPGPAMVEPLSDIAIAVGEWYPTADGDFVFSMEFQSVDPEGRGRMLNDMVLTGHGRLADDGETMSYEFREERHSLGDDPVVETGSVAATRFHLGDLALP